jgi:GTPase SAR1 family protein
MTTSRPVPVLPAQGRRVAFVGKGGAGKSTMLAHFLRYWKSYGVPCVGIDTDVPGDDENGTLYVHAMKADLGAPVYPAPAVHQIRNEAQRLCPEKGVCVMDTGAWERKKGGPHLQVVSAVDKVVLCIQPTGNELERAASVLGYIQTLKDTGAPAPELVIMLTMVGQGTVVDTVEEELATAGYTVLRSRYRFSTAVNSPAHTFGKAIKVRPGSDMDLMAREVLDVVAR